MFTLFSIIVFKTPFAFVDYVLSSMPVTPIGNNFSVRARFCEKRRGKTDDIRQRELLRMTVTIECIVSGVQTEKISQFVHRKSCKILFPIYT